MNTQAKLINKLTEVQQFIEMHYNDIYDSENLIDVIGDMIADQEDNTVSEHTEEEE